MTSRGRGRERPSPSLKDRRVRRRGGRSLGLDETQFRFQPRLPSAPNPLGPPFKSDFEQSRFIIVILKLKGVHGINSSWLKRPKKTVKIQETSSCPFAYQAGTNISSFSCIDGIIALLFLQNSLIFIPFLQE